MTPEREDEADQVSAAFHLALAYVGVASIEEALELWQRTPPAMSASVAAGWLEDAIRLILTRRGQSRELALAYYRLVRALHTGETIPRPGTPEPSYVTLTQLRDEFAELIPEQLDAPSLGTTDDLVRVDPDAVPDLASDLEEIERDAREEIVTILPKVGPIRSSRLNDELDTGRPAVEVEVERVEIHESSGRRTASTIERLVLNGARAPLFVIGGKDTKVIGWVRLSRTGTPCGWCAMLISRGLVKKNGTASFDGYTTQRSAGPTLEELENDLVADQDKYHPNCQCYAECVYSESHWERSSRFLMNREYRDLWPTATKGLGGRDALTEWRRYFRQLQAANDAQEAQAA